MSDFMNDINDPIAPPPQAAEEIKAENEPVVTRTENTAQPYAPVYTAADIGDSFSLAGNEDSMLMEVLKAILGAVIGALPGMFLWIIIGKVGFIAAICGTLLAGGTVCGYIFMTKDNFLPQKYEVIICVSVVVIGVFIAEKIVWCWEMSEQFKRVVATARGAAYGLGEAGGLSDAEIDRIVENSLNEQFGFTEGTFSDFFFNFNKTISYLGLSGRYYFNLLECYFFAALGGLSLFKRSAKHY